MTTDRPTGPPCGNNPNHKLSDGDRAAVEQFQAYLVIRAEQRATETDEERADREETERDHARGNHTYCGITCEVELPTEAVRNFVIAKGYPGTKGALDELLRRARTVASSARPEPIRALTLIEAANHLRDAHFRDGMSVQEIGTALRNTADETDPRVGSLARDGFGLDEIAAMLAAPAAPPAPAGRAAVLREAADVADEEARRLYDDMGQKAAAGARLVGARLRRLADEAQQAEPEPQPDAPTRDRFCTFGVTDVPGSGCVLLAGHEPANRHVVTDGDLDEEPQP